MNCFLCPTFSIMAVSTLTPPSASRRVARAQATSSRSAAFTKAMFSLLICERVRIRGGVGIGTGLGQWSIDHYFKEDRRLKLGLSQFIDLLSAYPFSIHLFWKTKLRSTKLTQKSSKSSLDKQSKFHSTLFEGVGFLTPNCFHTFQTV